MFHLYVYNVMLLFKPFDIKMLLKSDILFPHTVWLQWDVTDATKLISSLWVNAHTLHLLPSHSFMLIIIKSSPYKYIIWEVS